MLSPRSYGKIEKSKHFFATDILCYRDMMQCLELNMLITRHKLLSLPTAAPVFLLVWKLIEFTVRKRDRHNYRCASKERPKGKDLTFDMLRWINFLAFLVSEKTNVELKYSFPSKGLKLTVRKYINKRTARSRTRMKRARERARESITSTPTTNTHA